MYKKISLTRKNVSYLFLKPQDFHEWLLNFQTTYLIMAMPYICSVKCGCQLVTVSNRLGVVHHVLESLHQNGNQYMDSLKMKIIEK